MYSFWAIYSFRISFWSGAAQLVRAHALFFGGGNVHRPDDRRRRVDRHAGGYLVQRDALQQDLHILQGGDCHAAFAELAQALPGQSVS